MTRYAVLLRNQAQAVITRHLNDGPSMHSNGEARLIEAAAPSALVLFDVGANVGDYASHFLEFTPKNARAVLFEPSLSALSTLRGRLAGRRDVEILDQACGEREEVLSFFEEANAGQTSSFVERFSSTSAHPRKVRVTTVDAEAERRSISFVDVLKIDTEGYDLLVLQGARHLLHSERIGIVQFEYNHPWALAGSTLAAALSLLGNAGYDVYLLKRAGLYAFPYDVYGEFFGYANFVAVTRSRAHVLAHLVRGGIE